ncbi:autotransporter outer membrane beta-barrel domain-containing protein [Phenylobacterium deserti]|uniref:Autotransporter domain-containing protein n=1 Tax=Phenylobacterium deserti TaxID=1914756 RepID=A0A328ATG0_9CAUL|nr:autotransporter outer membrane beta-barrel domain-containing protein [Phenylobacterium deserti]RAK56976.1 autotransporter domain-containing protein [Phenylobacterium deserti]
MKRLFVTAAVLPLAYAVSAQAETKITTALTAPVSTATAANGQPDAITIEAAGSIRPTASGAAVTVNSNHAVRNNGTISFNNVSNATGVLVETGRSGSVVNAGAISLLEDFTPEDADKDGDFDGPFAQGSSRWGIRVEGPATFTGDVRNEAGGSIQIEGNDSAGIRIDPTLTGNLVSAGTVQVIGDRSSGIVAGDVTGDVRILGGVAVTGEGARAVSLQDVGGTVQLQSVITATGFRTTDRATDAVRAKYDADDLKIAGPAVRISGDVGRGVLLDVRPADADPNDTDEDDDGIADASEGSAAISSYGSSPALELGGIGGSTIGAVGTGENAYGLVSRGTVVANGVNDGLSATAIRIGQAVGGPTTVVGGINNRGGSIRAVAYGGDASSGGATALQINAGSVVPALRNSGVIEAATEGAQRAAAVVDASGSLTLVENTGVIRAASAAKAGTTAVGDMVALDLSANTTGVTVRQTASTVTGAAAPAISGRVALGRGADRLEVLGGALVGDMTFGDGADVLIVDGAAAVAGRISDSDGQLSVDVRNGSLAVGGVSAVQMSSLSLGSKGVLAVSVDPSQNASTQLNVSGAASLASGSKVAVNLTSLLKETRSFEIIRAGTLQSAADVSLAGAPYLYAGTLKAQNNSLTLDLRPKTAAELGLNRSGAQAYSAVFQALDDNAALEDAILAQTTQAGFQGVYDQLLPDHSGGALASANAISSAISQAVAQPIARSTEFGGAVWAQEILFRIEQDRDQAQGFESQGFGLAVGAEAVGQFNAIGLTGSLVTTDYNDVGAAPGERVTMNFAEGGVYWRATWGGLTANARAGLGYVKLKSERKVSSDLANASANADWTGWLADLHAGLAYEASLGRVYARPELSVNYLRLDEDAYQETGGGAGYDLAVDERKGDLLTGEALLALGARFGNEFTWGPELKLGWRAKLSGDPGATTARFAGGQAFTLDPEDVAGEGAVARFGFKGEGAQVVYAVDAGGVFGDGYTEYDLRAAVRFLF